MPEKAQKKPEKPSSPEPVKAPSGTEGKEAKKTFEQRRDEQKKKVTDFSEKLKQKKSSVVEKKTAEKDKRDFLKNEYQYESKSNNPPDNDEDAGVEEHYFGEQKRQREAAEGEFSSALSQKHNAEIAAEILQMDTTKVDEKTLKIIHLESLRAGISEEFIQKLPEETKKTVLGQNSTSEPIDYNKLTPVQIRILQRYQAQKYLTELRKIPDDIKKDPKIFSDTLQKLAGDILGNVEVSEDEKKLLLEETFREEIKTNPDCLEAFTELIQKDGLVISGLERDSDLYKSLRTLGEKSIEEFFSVTSEKDMRKISRILPQLYNDAMSDPEFKLDDALQASRQKILSLTKHGEGLEGLTAEEIKDVTGFDVDHISNVQSLLGGTTNRDELHPLVRFLADLFSGIGVAMEENGMLKGDFWRRYANKNKNSAQENGEDQFARVEMTGNVSGEEFASHAATFVGKPYVWGGEFENGGGGDCSGLVVRTLRDKGCMGNARPTAAEFRRMSQEVGTNEGQVGDFIIKESGSGATHIQIIEKNNGDGTYEVIEAKGKAYGTLRSHVTAGGNLGVYKNPFLTENAQYAGKLSQGGRGREGGYATEFHANEHYTPNPAEIAGVNVDMGPIQGWEGTDYMINYPGSAASGHTIGHGYDLRFYSPERIAADWGSYLTGEQIAILQAYSGKQFSDTSARLIQEKFNRLPGGFADFRRRIDTHKAELLKTKTLPKFIAETKSIYPEIIHLEPRAQTALVSLVYNRGSGNIFNAKRAEMGQIKQHLAAFDSYKRNGREKEFYNKLAGLFEHMNETRSDWPSGLKRRRREEAALIRQCGAFVDLTKSVQNIENQSQNSPANWFKQNAGKVEYGRGPGKYDCMTSTHAALGLNYDDEYGRAFNARYIDTQNDNNNLWNVSMSSALYAGAITGANSSARNGIIQKQSSDYYGTKHDDPTNMEYYIEENVMKRSAGKKIEVSVPGTLTHYGAGFSRSEIIRDIDNKLKEGEGAMMGGTGEGTNKHGHEWLVVREGGELRVYESTKTKPDDWRGSVNGIQGKGYSLNQYLSGREKQHPTEAIIFAKK